MKSFLPRGGVLLCKVHTIKPWKLHNDTAGRQVLQGQSQQCGCTCCLHVFHFDSPNTNAHILSVTCTTGLFSESGRLNDAVELERLVLGLVLPVVRVRAVGVTTLSLSGSFAEDAAPPPSQLHIAQGHGPPIAHSSHRWTSDHVVAYRCHLATEVHALQRLIALRISPSHSMRAQAILHCPVHMHVTRPIALSKRPKQAP